MASVHTVKKEALNNEIKGYLFEYLTARKLATLLGCEGAFLRDEVSADGKRLREYETWLRRNDPVLMERLPVLAHETVQLLNAKLSPEGEAVRLCGRRPEDSQGEADIFLEGKPSLSIGLKLCKANAFVNTKSGGLRSFLIKYFGTDTHGAQERLNRALDWSFDCMAGQLYESAGLEYTGRWDHSWIDAGYSLLPGELSEDRNAFVLEHYGRVVDVLYEEMEKYREGHPANFVQSLPPLLGFKNPDLVQLFCFYRRDYQLEDIVIVDGRTIVWQDLSVRIGERIPKRSSFEIVVEDRVLQIRVKPMNKFNARAMKVNCSVKWKAPQ